MPSSSNKLSRFWQELKRRRVIHVVVVYASAAFVIIELVNNVYETLRLPDWMPAFTLIILVIGFPLALIFSWIFDVTPQGLEKTKPVEDLNTDSVETRQPISRRNRQLGKIINWGLIGILIFMIGVYLITKSNIHSDDTEIVKFSEVLSNNEFLDWQNWGSSIAMSPDGSRFVYVCFSDSTSYLVLRDMDNFISTRMNGTEGASSPFFSRNSDWIGFFADGYLKKVHVLGGVPLNICEIKEGYDGCWIDENTIIFADAFKRCLMLVPSTGGIPRQITTSIKYIEGNIEQLHSRPQVLPGGKEILYTIINNRDDVRIAAMSLETGEKWNLVDHGCNGIYVSSGHLVYTWKGDLMAVPFDCKQMKVKGDPVMIVDGVLMDVFSRAQLSISDDGSLVYIPGDIIESVDKPVMVDILEGFDILNMPRGGYQSPRFSPDGKQILICHETDFWIYELKRSTFRLITQKGYMATWAIWSPDGNGIVYNSNRGGPALNLYLKQLDETVPVERLTESDYQQQPYCWTNNGKFLIFSEGINPETGLDLFLLQMDNKEITPLLNSSANEAQPNLSRDGRWLAYISDESGREDVYVTSFPTLTNKQQVSLEGGVEPIWAPDGDKLYFRDISGKKVMVVSILVNEDGTLEFGKPQLVIEGDFKSSLGPWGRNYDLSPDGKKFVLIAQERSDILPRQINIVLNWQQELSELVPAAK